MQAIYFLLLAVYASITTAQQPKTVITWTWGSKWTGASRDRIGTAMKEAADFYMANTQKCGTQNVVVDYDPNLNNMVATRNPPRLVFPPIADFQVKYVAIWGISHVLGVGNTPAWNTRCKADGYLYWGLPQTVMQNEGKMPGAKIVCHGQKGSPYFRFNFYPFGLSDWKFSDDIAKIHVHMVEAMVMRGLQTDKPQNLDAEEEDSTEEEKEDTTKEEKEDTTEKEKEDNTEKEKEDTTEKEKEDNTEKEKEDKPTE